jgi:CDP-6-deoxy-D-xylo-4-hexulose-3-dehydrase
MSKEQIREQIIQLVGQYGALSTAAKEFVPGVSVVPPSGKVIGAPELQLMVDASLDGWLTTGRFNDMFEARLAKFLGVTWSRSRP